MNKLWERIKTEYKKSPTENQKAFPNLMKTSLFYFMIFILGFAGANNIPITIKPVGVTTGKLMLLGLTVIFGMNIYWFIKKHLKKKEEIEQVLG